jgi:hypothetical protein
MVPANKTERGKRTPAYLIACLTLASLGGSVPFGLASGPYDQSVTAVEWGFSVLELVALLALLARLFGLLRPRRDSWALAISAGAWTAIACYAGFFLDGATYRYRVGMGLIFLSIAAAAACSYATETIG